MRFFIVAATLGGLLIVVAFVVPVAGDWFSRPDKRASFGPMPLCLTILESNPTTGKADSYEVVLTTKIRDTIFGSPWYQVGGDGTWWQPVLGDSLDVVLYYDGGPILRFPRGDDTVEGRELWMSYHNIWEAIVSSVTRVRAVPMTCRP